MFEAHNVRYTALKSKFRTRFASAGLPVVQETSLLHLEDLPTLVPITSSNMGTAIAPTDSLELSDGNQNPSNCMHPDRHAERLRSHRAHPDETDAVRSLLSVNTGSSMTESSSSPSVATGSLQTKAHPNESRQRYPERSSQAAVDVSVQDSCTRTQDVRTAASLDGATSVAFTDVGSKTAEEVEALPGQQSMLLVRCT